MAIQPVRSSKFDGQVVENEEIGILGIGIGLLVAALKDVTSSVCES